MKPFAPQNEDIPIDSYELISISLIIMEDYL